MHLLHLTLLFLVASSSASVISITTNHPKADIAFSRTPVHTLSSWQYIDCGLSTDIVNINSITISPNPVPGKEITVTADIAVNSVIEDGAYIYVTVKLGLIKLFQKQFNICEELDGGDVTLRCPIQKGTYTLSQTVKLPREIPPAKFSIAARAYTVEDEDIMCADFFVDFYSRQLAVGRVGL
ncbi:ML domain-containing protein [Rhexocercosporidium sp. MPI-PUGE-AT-0058]|nr:ML domain-containing protein [Rhexocercosporidium sp. MPI-PUGE-AT-0058]